jgi:type I restriction-modification system DNA methylase subunit
LRCLPGLDKQRLGQLINLVSDIALGAPADRAKDTLGRVYEYFLALFASAEGKKGGQFYTPSHVVRILVEMLAPYKGRVYDLVAIVRRPARAAEAESEETQMLDLWASFRDAYDALRGPYGHSDSEDFWLAMQRL